MVNVCADGVKFAQCNRNQKMGTWPKIGQLCRRLDDCDGVLRRRLSQIARPNSNCGEGSSRVRKYLIREQYYHLYIT
jgi:hypothetical protein